MKDKVGFLWDFLSQTVLHPALGLVDVCELVYWFWSETDEKSLKGFMVMKISHPAAVLWSGYPAVSHSPRPPEGHPLELH